MKFEGTQVNIPIKGIMRAGTDNLADDGAMQEVVGMEYKDGSWLPYQEKVEDWTVQTDETQPAHVEDILKVYIHKAFDRSSHYVFVDAGGHAHVQTAIDTTNKIITVKELESDVTDVSFVGDMLCFATTSGLRFYYWDGTEYVAKQATITSIPTAELRGGYGFKRNNEKIYGIHYCQYHKTGDEQDTSINRYILAALGALTNEGGLSGYCLAQIAFRMKNGNILCVSPMQLIGCPFKEYTYTGDNYDNYASGFAELNPDETDSFRPEGTQSGARRFLYQSYRGQKGDTYIILNSRNNGVVYKPDSSHTGVHGLVKQNDGSVLIDSVDSNSRLRIWSSLGDSPASYGPAEVPSLMPSIYTWWTGSDASEHQEAYYEVLAAGNGLQFRVTSIPANTEIQSVCVFLSQEVSPFIDIEKEMASNHNFKWWNFDQADADVPGGHWKSYRIVRRREDEIIEDIRKINNLYLVHEVLLSDLTASNDWIDIDLQGMLGSNLVTLETLPLSSLHSDMLNPTPKWLDAYNMRLHLYDYTLKLFDGYGLKDFFNKGGLYQPAKGTAAPTSHNFIYDIAVEIDGDNGDSRVDRKTIVGESGSSLSSKIAPFVMYPDENAKKMHIRMYDVSNLNSGHIQMMYEQTIELKPMSGLGIACGFGSSIKPIRLTQETVDIDPADITYETYNTTKHYANGLRLSDTAYPMSLPVKYAYRFGHGELIGLAQLTLPLSQDNAGRFPLIIFATDGIYTLEVDTSGNGAYTNQAFVSPEVCVNRNSICEIGGAIFFAADKGLMVLTGNNQVELYAPHLNGAPRFLPATQNDKTARGIYKKMLDNPQILSKTAGDFSGTVSDSDFVDYIKNTSTHLVYISVKNKLLAFNSNFAYAYFIDIPTGNTTKLAMRGMCDDGQLVDKHIWNAKDNQYQMHEFGYLSESDDDIPCLVLSRPIKVQQDDKNSYRVVLSGYFNGDACNWADLIVLGSLDADNWRVIGVKEKKLAGGFHNIGCVTGRESWKYMMFIFGGKLTSDSHIDSVDITVDGRYNNKKR